jgi:flagellar biosynthesis/type III secretory pathway protein FliH
MFYRNAREKLSAEEESNRFSFQSGYDSGYLEGKRAALQEMDAAHGEDEDALQEAFRSGFEEGKKAGHQKGWVDALSQFFPGN